MNGSEARQITRRASKAIRHAVSAANSPLLTVKEAAEILRCHQSTTYRLIERGVLPAFRIGSDWRIDKRELEAWMTTQPRNPAST